MSSFGRWCLITTAGVYHIGGAVISRSLSPYLGFSWDACEVTTSYRWGRAMAYTALFSSTGARMSSNLYLHSFTEDPSLI